jgi:hypothetical protein
MKNSNKRLTQLPPKESSSLRLAYKNEDVINNDTKAGKEKSNSHTKVPRLFVKEPLPLFNDYRFKAKDHDPL